MPSVQEGESYASVYVCMGLFLCTMASLAIYGFITQRHCAQRPSRGMPRSMLCD